MRMKKILCTTLIMGMMLPQVITCGSVSAMESGTWKHDTKGWWYSYADGSYAKSEWVKVGEKWYYFNASGYMVTGWQKIGKKWYYFNAGGDMVTGWNKIGKKWYYFNAGGDMVTGWKRIGRKWYFFNSSGIMTTGWKQISKKWYFFNSDGTMTIGWKQISGNWYFFDANGEMVTGTKTIEGKTYEFGSDGVWIENPGNSELAEAEVGDVITFGKYEQDNDMSNGKEDIEWIVLEKKEDGGLLVISKYGLDCQKYHSERETVTWENCSLRAWLNDSFLNSAFSADEKAKIQTSLVKDEEMSFYSIGGATVGNDTNDQVFLLSFNEAGNLFGEDILIGEGDDAFVGNYLRACQPTAYAIEQGCCIRNYFDNESDKPLEGTCFWFLRTPSFVWDNNWNQVGSMAVVTPTGICADISSDVWFPERCPINGYTAVRPAMVITP